MLKEGDGGRAVDDDVHLSADSFQVSGAQAAVSPVHIALHHDQLAQNGLQRVLAAGVVPEERPASEQSLEARLACTMSLLDGGPLRRASVQCLGLRSVCDCPSMRADLLEHHAAHSYVWAACLPASRLHLTSFMSVQPRLRLVLPGRLCCVVFVLVANLQVRLGEGGSWFDLLESWRNGRAWRE